MEATFLPIVKPELKTEFLECWDKWFVLEDTVRDEKTPGFYFLYISFLINIIKVS